MPKLTWDSDDFDKEQDRTGIPTGIDDNDKLQQGYIHGSLTRGLIAYYPFDGDVNDATPVGNDGTNNGASFVSGKIDQTADFNPDNSDWVDIPNGIFGSDDSWTVAMWFNIPADSGKETLINLRADVTFQIQPNRSTSGKIDVWTGNHQTDLYSFTGNSWEHIVVTHDGSGNFNLFSNGSSTTSWSDSGYGSDSSKDNGIGKVSSNPIDGKIDDVRIYDRTLSEPEITALHNLTSTSTVTETDVL